MSRKPDTMVQFLKISQGPLVVVLPNRRVQQTFEWTAPVGDVLVYLRDKVELDVLLHVESNWGSTKERLWNSRQVITVGMDGVLKKA